MRKYVLVAAVTAGAGLLLLLAGIALWIPPASWLAPAVSLVGLTSLLAVGGGGLGILVAKVRSEQYLMWQLQCDRAVRELRAMPRYSDGLRLNTHEAKVYSQGGEDGILQEIFRRIGTTNKVFCEFGASDGIQNNTVFLLNIGWSGLWIEGGEAAVRRATQRYASYIGSGKLKVQQAFVTAENIESLFQKADLPEAFDLLSIDIDRNDYYVWAAITRYQPRAVVIEFSSVFPPGIDWVIPYDANKLWDGSSRTGATLTAYERLGRAKGYALVGCSLSGVNAFFVREDLAQGKFAAPFTAENHYEPPRHYLNWYTPGQRRNP